MKSLPVSKSLPLGNLPFSINYFYEIITFSKRAIFKQSLPNSIHYFTEITTFF